MLRDAVLALALLATAEPCRGAAEPGQDAEAPGGSRQDQVLDTWTGIVPDAFPHIVYTWRLAPDGSYREDGADARTGAPVQRTFSGTWQREDATMTLRQSEYPYLFDGTVLGDRYAGTLSLSGRAVSRFCARRGDRPPQSCEGVAISLNLPSGPEGQEIR